MIMSNSPAKIFSQRAGLFLTVLAVSIMGSGCAMIPRENRPLTHALAEHLIPEGTPVYSGGYPMMALITAP